MSSEDILVKKFKEAIARLQSEDPWYSRALKELYAVAGEDKKKLVSRKLFEEFRDAKTRFNLSDIEAIMHAIRMVRKDFMLMRQGVPGTTIYLIPIGIAPIIYAKTKDIFMSRIIGLTSEDGSTWEKNSILVFGQTPKVIDDILEQIIPFSKYTITVAKRRIGYTANEQSKINLEQERIVRSNIEKLEFLKEKFGAKFIKIAEVRKKGSKLVEYNKKMFTDPLDIRILDVQVLKLIQKAKPVKDEVVIEKAVYLLSDETVPLEATTDDEGYPLPEVLIGIAHRNLGIYDVDSELYVYGTIKYNYDEENASATALMSIYWIIPKLVYQG